MHENLVQRTSTHEANGVNERGTAIHILSTQYPMRFRLTLDF